MKEIDKAREKKDVLLACQGRIGLAYEMSEEYEKAITKLQAQRAKDKQAVKKVIKNTVCYGCGATVTKKDCDGCVNWKMFEAIDEIYKEVG